MATLKAAFSGDPFEFHGRTVQVTPAPFRPGGPAILLGGSSKPRPSAPPASPTASSPPTLKSGPTTSTRSYVWVAPIRAPVPSAGPRPWPWPRTLSRGWEQMAPYFMHEMNAYGAWQAQDNLANPYRTVADLDGLRASGNYRVMAPAEMVEEQKGSPFPFAMFHPLCGGMPIDLAWSSLRLFEGEVLPAFQ